MNTKDRCASCGGKLKYLGISQLALIGRIRNYICRRCGMVYWCSETSRKSWQRDAKEAEQG